MLPFIDFPLPFIVQRYSAIMIPILAQWIMIPHNYIRTKGGDVDWQGHYERVVRFGEMQTRHFICVVTSL